MTNIKFEYEEMLTPEVKLRKRSNFWCAGQQLQALRFYLKPDVDMIWSYQVPDYSGSCFALLKYKNQYVLWRDSFGSCSGCDALDGRSDVSGKKYILETLTEGNCKRFDNPYDIVKFLVKTKDYHWRDLTTRNDDDDDNDYDLKADGILPLDGLLKKLQEEAGRDKV